MKADHARTAQLAELKRMREELNEISRSVDELATDLARGSRLVGEEAVGAELLAGRELVAQAGIFWSLAESLQRLALGQTELLVRDHLHTLGELFDPSLRGRPAAILGAHLERRLRHSAEGLAEGADLVAASLDESSAAARRMWESFTAVVRNDWSDPDRRSAQD